MYKVPLTRFFLFVTQAEAKHANEIKEKAQVCYMYICIAVEVIVLVLLIILTVTH